MSKYQAQPGNKYDPKKYNRRADNDEREIQNDQRRNNDEPTRKANKNGDFSGFQPAKMVKPNRAQNIPFDEEIDRPAKKQQMQQRGNDRDRDRQWEQDRDQDFHGRGNYERHNQQRNQQQKMQQNEREYFDHRNEVRDNSQDSDQRQYERRRNQDLDRRPNNNQRDERQWPREQNIDRRHNNNQFHDRDDSPQSQKRNKDNRQNPTNQRNDNFFDQRGDDYDEYDVRNQQPLVRSLHLPQQDRREGNYSKIQQQKQHEREPDQDHYDKRVARNRNQDDTTSQSSYNTRQEKNRQVDQNQNRNQKRGKQNPNQNGQIRMSISRREHYNEAYHMIGIIHKLLGFARGKATINVTLDNFDEDFVDKIYDEFEMLKLDRINFKLVEKDQTLEELSQSQRLDRTAESEIQQIPDQPAQMDPLVLYYEYTDYSAKNTKQNTMILHVVKYFKEMYQDAQENNLKVSLDGASFKILFQCVDGDPQFMKRFYKYWSRQFNFTVPLMIQCRDESDLNIKLDLLKSNEGILRDGLGQMYKGEILHTGMFKITNFVLQDSTFRQAMQQFLSQKIIFFYLEKADLRDCDADEKLLQDILDEIYKEKEKQIVVKLDYMVADMDSRRVDIQKLAEKFQVKYFVIEQEMVDNYFVVVIDLYYYLKPKESFDQKKFEKLAKQIEQQFSSKLKLKLQSQQQKDLWDYLLKDIITQESQLENITIQQKQKKIPQGRAEYYRIIFDFSQSFKGKDEQQMKQHIKDVRNMFDSFSSEQAQIRVPDKTLVKILQSQSIIRGFKNYFEKIQSEFPYRIGIQVMQNRGNSDALYLTLHFDKRIKKSDIVQSIEKNLISQLRSKTFEVDCTELLRFTQSKNIFELEEQFEVVVVQQSQRVTFVGTGDSLEKITKTIEIFERHQIKELEELSIELDSILELKYIKENLEAQDLMVPPSFVDKTLIIKADPQEIDGISQKIDDLREAFQAQLETVSVTLSKFESDFLETQHKKDLQSIQTQFECLIQDPHHSINARYQNPFALMNVQPQQQQKTYQFYWQDNTGPTEYIAPVNLKINNAYNDFIQDNRKNLVEIENPVDHLPGTHIVNLDTMQVTDIKLLTVESLTLTQGRYYINGIYNQEASWHIEKHKIQGQRQFQIFLKKYRIQFIDSDTAVQINQATNYKRAITKKLISSPNQGQLNAQPQNNQGQTTYKNVKQLSVYKLQGLDKENLNQASKQLFQIISDSKDKDNFWLPEIEDSKFLTFIQSIQEQSLIIEGQMVQGATVEITSFKDNLRNIKNMIDCIPRIEYPNYWDPQQVNLIKVQLQSNNQEYKQIQQDFLKSLPQGKIHQINRIQNKHLYRNYLKEKKDLIALYSSKGKTLSNFEQETSLWHGVRGQHPKIIYESNKEGFDPTYANLGMWGMGMYFATTAIYSQAYSYVLTHQDSAQFYGKKVFLYCFVTLGKVHQCESDQSLRRPPQGYDSIGGVTQQTQVYILYGMEIRRAYPAYEIIYE